MDTPQISSPINYFIVFIFASLELFFTAGESTVKGPYDICELDVFNGTCPQGQVIMMESALYGLMQPSTCIRHSINSRNCDIDVMNIMDGFCSGAQTCAVKPTDNILIATKPCPAYAAYLKAAYKCLKTFNDQSYTCSSDNTIDDDSGFLSSVQRHSNGPGSAFCPWTLTAEGGRRFVVSLLKFVPFKNSPLSSSSSVCFEIGTVQEGNVAQGILTCGSDPRKKEVFRSKGGPVRLHFKGNDFLKDLGRFLIHFEAIDCPDPAIPEGASFTREGHMALVRCNGLSPWQLICENGRWTGEMGECSKAESTSVLRWVKTNTKYSIGLLIIVTLGCAAVIFFCGFCIYVTMFYCTRKHQNQPAANADYTMDIYKLQTMQRLKASRPPSIAVYERTTSLHTPPGTMRRNTDYQRMNPIDPDTVSHHSYVLYDHVPKPLPPIPIQDIAHEKKHIYETPLPVNRD